MIRLRPAGEKRTGATRFRMARERTGLFSAKTVLVLQYEVTWPHDAMWDNSPAGTRWRDATVEDMMADHAPVTIERHVK